MNGLIPVKKLDKNGKLVTRHMKPEQVGNSSAWLKALAPKSVTNERERIIRDCGDFIRDGENEIALSSLGDEELADLNSVISKIELDSDFMIMRELFNPTKNAPHNDPVMWPELKYDLERLARYNRLDIEAPLKTTLPLLRGINAYEHWGIKESAYQALINTSLAASKLLSTTIGNGFVYPKVPRGKTPDNLDNFYSFFEDDGEVTLRWIRNRRFVDLVARRAAEVEEIIRIMNERNTLQPETIESILDFDSHSSLKAGAL